MNSVEGGFRIMNKVVKIMSCLGIFFFIAFFTVEEIEAATYEGNSGVGFYGEYIFPDEEQPSVKPDPDVEDQSLVDLPTGPTSQGKVPIGNGHFPQTGVKQENVLGIGVLIFMVAFLFRYKTLKGEC